MATRRRKPAASKAPAKGRGRSKKRTISVDFTDVETRVTIPEGDYRMAVAEVTEEEGSGEYPYLKWKFKTVHGSSKLNNKTVYTNTSLSPQALWNLRNLLEALGVETPDSAYELDLDAVVDMEIVGTIEHETYEDDEGNDKVQMRIVDYIPLTDDFEEDSAGGVVDDEDEDDADDEEDEDDEDEDEDDEDEGEEESDDDEGDGEDITEEDVQDMNADELNDTVEAYELDVDFKGMRSLRKKQNAVIAALKEEGYIS